MKNQLIKIFGIAEIILGVLLVIILTIADSAQFIPSLVVLAALLILGLTNIWASSKINKIINAGVIIELIGICIGIIIFLLSPIINKGPVMFPPSLGYIIIIVLPLVLVGFITKLIGIFARKKA